jgi:lysophospholipase L1-like esterase
VYIYSIFKENNINFTVILFPYEYQLREGSQDILFPQKILKKYFDLYNISYIDTYDALNKYIRDMNLKPKDLFLFNDPIHLSENGHKIVAEILNNEIKERN